MPENNNRPTPKPEPDPLVQAMVDTLKGTATGIFGIEAALAAKAEGRSDKEARLEALIQILLPAASVLVLSRKASGGTLTDREMGIAVLVDIGGLLFTLLAPRQGIGPALSAKVAYNVMANYLAHVIYPIKK